MSAGAKPATAAKQAGNSAAFTLPDPLPKFLNVREVAALLRVSTRTIYDWVSQRKIPFRKAGDRTIFLRDEILEWTQPEGAE